MAPEGQRLTFRVATDSQRCSMTRPHFSTRIDPPQPCGDSPGSLTLTSDCVTATRSQRAFFFTRDNGNRVAVGTFFPVDAIRIRVAIPDLTWVLDPSIDPVAHRAFPIRVLPPELP